MKLFPAGVGFIPMIYDQRIIMGLGMSIKDISIMKFMRSFIFVIRELECQIKGKLWFLLHGFHLHHVRASSSSL